MASQNRQIGDDDAMDTAQQTTDPAIIAAAGSVALSWYYFFAKGDKQRGLFVGLWPPTILAFASYFQQNRMMDKIESAMSIAPSSVRESVQKMVGGQ